MKTRIIVICSLAAMLMAGCAKKDGAAGDAGANAKADSMKTAYKAIAVAWDAGNVDEFDKYMTVNSVDHNAMSGQKPGLAGMKEMAKMLKAGYPDEKSTIEDMRVDGDNLIVRFHMTGTNSGPMMGMPATGKKINIMGIDWLKWENGKFTEHWGAMEEMKMMTQLGLMPPMGGGAPPPPPPPPPPAKK